MHLNKILIRLSNRYDTHQLCPIAIIPRSNLHILWDIIVKFQKNGEVSTRFSVREMADMLLITCLGYILYCFATNNFTDLENRMASHLSILASGFCCNNE